MSAIVEEMLSVGSDEVPSASKRGRTMAASVMAYVWPAVGVAVATAAIMFARPFDKGQASLLYLPVVIVCAMRFGFGPAILGALLSFLCWDWFFLPPYQTLIVANPKDWISLVVFLIVALITAHLASQARAQAGEARTRLQEMSTLFQAGDAMSHEVSASQALATFARQLKILCNAGDIVIFRRPDEGGDVFYSTAIGPDADGVSIAAVERMARAAFEHDRIIGIGELPRLWAKAMSIDEAPAPSIDPKSVGVYIPLHAADMIVGILHVAARRDGEVYTPMQERLILTLANHAAAVIARETLSARAAQATALKQADALKDTLLSLVSHELRTPLAAIKASASGLLQKDATWNESERHEALVSIDSETDRLSNIVSNLLDLSRLEAGAWKPNRDWCNFGDVVDTALQRLSPANAQRVRVSIPPDTLLIRIDHAQVALVVENLLQNAVKYSPESSPIDVTVTTEYDGVNEAPQCVAVRVRDYGDGIVPEEAEQLFSRFYRSHRHQRGSVHGTGIGLALCKAVVIAHGGSIEAGNARVGEAPGAVFTIRLPFVH